MTVTNGYLTAQEAATYIGRQFPDGSGILDDAITAVSRMIDRHCGRHFYTVTATRYFDTDCADELELGPYNDLVSVTTLKSDADGDGVYETTHTSDTYQLCPVGATSRAPYAEPYTEIELLSSATLFPLYSATGREKPIQIVGSWGWPTAVPVEVKQAARILIAEMAALQHAPLGLAGSPEFGLSRVPSRMPARAADLLAPLVHPDHVGIA